MSEILRVQLPIELFNANEGRSRAWFNSARVRKAIEIDLRAQGLVREPFEFPVEIELIRVLGPRQRLWDADSGFRGNAKELIDALVAVGWFVDDGAKWVKQATFSQDATQRKNGPGVIVVISKD